MKKYNSYKDTGIDWLGEIPEHWDITKLKYLAKIFNGNSLKDDLKVQFLSTNINYKPYIGTKNIDPNTGQIDYNNGLRIPKDEEAAFKLAPKGSFLLCIEGGSAGKKIAFLDENVFFVNKLACFNSSNKYMFYFANSSFFKNQFNINLSGLISGVSINNLKNLIGLNLPSFEQTQIANYLDQKTTQIDELIAKKEQLIQLLEEERTAIINRAVTKGLNPDAPMKDSGIDWLGEIPKHWDIKRLRYVGNCQNGISEGAEFFGEGYPFVSYSDVFHNRTLPLKVDGLAKSNEKHWRNYSVIEGDVFFTRTSETIEEIGIASVCQRNIDKATFAGFLIRFRPYPDTLMSGFSKYYFRCFIPRIFFVKEMNLVTRASLSQELLKRLPVLLPSLKEQVLIAEYLDEKVGQIESVITKTKTEILLLKEYKTTLISDVVTGKIDVREEVLN